MQLTKILEFEIEFHDNCIIMSSNAKLKSN